MTTDHSAERTASHLALLRRPQPLSGREFNALPVEEQLDLLRLVQGRQKYNLLLETADAPELVARLPAQELYLLLSELGPEDVPELLMLVSDEQLTCFLDLDCWQGESMVPAKVLRWFALLLEAGEGRVLEVAQELDHKLLVLMLRTVVSVVRGPEDIDSDDVRAEAMRRDGGYQLEFVEPEGGKVVVAFLEILFRHDQDLYLRLLEGTRWELLAGLEEEVYAERAGRLLDLGFPEPIAAQAVYAWLDPERFDPAAAVKRPLVPLDEVVPPGFVLTASRPKGLLATVLADGLDDAGSWELSFLVNKVLLADAVDPGDAEAVRRTVARVGQMLNLALEYLAGSDTGRAAVLFRQCYFEHLFRLGFSLTLRLRLRAQVVARSAAGPFLDRPFRAQVEALVRSRPAYYEGLDGGSRGGERPFVTLDEIRRADEALAGVEAQCRLFAGALPFPLPNADTLDLTGCVPAQFADLTLSGLLLTAMANRVLGRPFAPAPIIDAELPELQRLVSRDGLLDPRLREELVGLLEGLVPGAGTFAAWCCERWQEEFCQVPPAQLDPRFLGGMLIRRGAGRL